jgi:imidazolonepropionase-like amidohydrolase
MKSSKNLARIITTATLACGVLAAAIPAVAQQDEQPPRVLFTNVHVFDGVNEKRIENANVLVEGNLIKAVSSEAIEAEGATLIDGGGRTLMPVVVNKDVA